MRVLLSESEIQTRVKELGNSISKDFAGKDILLLGILKGSFLFLADLARSIDCNTEVQFLQATSYGASTKSSGHVNLFYDENILFQKKHLIVVEDIIDTGLTLQRLLEELGKKNPLSISICSLLLKKGKTINTNAKLYHGFEIEDHFVVGYGLDYNEKYRNLRDIFVLNHQ